MEVRVPFKTFLLLPHFPGSALNFSPTSGNVTDDIILQCLELHSRRDAAGASRWSFTWDSRASEF